MKALLTSFAATLVLLAAAPGHAQTASQGQCRVLFDFEEDGALADWNTVNDNVMGGRSSGGPSVANGTLVFSGTINTDGGGFSSIGAGVREGQLRGATEFRLRYKADGRRYLFSVETGERRRLFFRVQYWSRFETVADGGWREVRLPVSGFRPYFRGRQVEASALDPAQIDKLGFFINDGREGPFNLQIDWIKAC